MSYSEQSICTSEIGLLMAEGIQKVVGKSGYQALDQSVADFLQHHQPASADRPFAELTALQSALEQQFGGSGGRGIALRAGRTAFTSLMHTHENSLGWDQVQFRMQPTPLRLAGGLKALAGLLSLLIGTEIAAEKDEHGWRLKTVHCPFCYHREATESVCHFLLGLVQEYFAWASSGKVYQVREIECCATGGEACVLFIDKEPLN